MQAQPDHQGELHKQDQGQAPAEIPVLRLMMENVHPQGSPQAAPQEGKEEKGGFRHPPFALLGLALVRPHGDEGDNAPEEKPGADDFQYHFSCKTPQILVDFYT